MKSNHKHLHISRDGDLLVRAAVRPVPRLAALEAVPRPRALPAAAAAAPGHDQDLDPRVRRAVGGDRRFVLAPAPAREGAADLMWEPVWKSNFGRPKPSTATSSP